MFLKFLKNFLLKRKLKNSLSNVKNDFPPGAIITAGLLIDESYFSDKAGLIDELQQNGIDRENIKVLIYKDRFKKNEVFSDDAFSLNDISWQGDIVKKEAREFTEQPFDMLISYYDIEKSALLLVTQKSKARFKVGFSTVDKRMNHFMITTVAENYKIFTSELFKYLKILNKI